MRVDVRTQAVIRRPREEVAAFAAEPDNAPAWYANLRSVRWRTPPPVTEGSELEFVARFLGRELRYVYRVTELVPGRRMVMRTADGPFPMETTYEWEDVPPAASRMTLRNRGEPAGFSRWLAPLLAPAMRRANRKDLARLRKILEG